MIGHGNYSDSTKKKEFWVFSVEEAWRLAMGKNNWPINAHRLLDSVRSTGLLLKALSRLAGATSEKCSDVEICGSCRGQVQFKGIHPCPAGFPTN